MLLFLKLISFKSYGKWVKTGINSYDDRGYIDSDGIKKLMDI